MPAYLNLFVRADMYLHPACLNLTVSGFTLILESTVGGVKTYTGALYWLAIGPGTLIT